MFNFYTHPQVTENICESLRKIDMLNENLVWNLGPAKFDIKKKKNNLEQSKMHLRTSNAETIAYSCRNTSTVTLKV